MEQTERLYERLTNVRAIEPILSALRTIAGATWRAAVNRLRNSQQFLTYTEEIASLIAPYVEPPQSSSGEASSAEDAPEALIVISAERGMCGGFNRTILDAADDLLDEALASGTALLPLTIGERAARHFRRRGLDILRAESLPLTSLMPFCRARDLARWIIQAHERGGVGRVRVIFNHYVSPTSYRPVVRQLLPIRAPGPSTIESHNSGWPPPIIETDPTSINVHITEQLIAVQLYSTIIESEAAEQSARLQAMERSSQNAQRLIEELSLSYHQARQEAITQEMLDLAAGAGMVAGTREEDNSHD